MKDKFIKLLEDKDFKEILNNASISFLMRVGGQIMGFALTFIIAHYFGANGLGDYVLAIIVLRIFVMLAKLGIDTASIKLIASLRVNNDWLAIKLYRNKVSILLFFTSLIASFIMFFCSLSIADLVGANPYYIKLNSFFIIPMVFFILNYQSLRGLKKITEFSFFYWMSRIAASTIIILIAVQFSTNENIPIFAFLLALVIVFILSYFVFIKSLKSQTLLSQNPKTKTTPIYYKEIFILSLPLLLAQSGQFMMSWTDKLMIGGFWHATDVGVYDVSSKLSMFVNIALTSIASITSPKFAETYSLGDMSKLKKIVMQATKISFWSTLPLFIAFVLIAPFILNIFGDDFTIGFHVLCVLSFARLVSALTGPAATLLQMTGRQVIFMKVLFLGAIINIIANYFLIPIYGILC